MYAVIRTGGKQYRVSKGDKLRIEKVPGKAGDDFTFDNVLMIGGIENIKLGRPLVEGAKVTARILVQDRAKKVIVYKFKRRKNYHKTQGHRQYFTQIEITDITNSTPKKAEDNYGA